jgi:WD40 repeat protein
MRILVVALGLAVCVVMYASAAMAPADLLSTISAHHSAVNALAVMPQSGTVGYSGGKDGRVIFWDTATGEKLSELMACQVAINDIAVSPDETLIATAGADGFIKVWDAQSGDLMTALDAHRIAANSVAWTDMSGAGLRVYSGGDDGYVRGWSVDDDYAMVQEWRANEGGVNVVVINSAGSYVYSGGVDGRVMAFSINGGTRESVVQAYPNAEVLSMAFNSVESCLATGGTNGEVRGWDASTGSLVREIRAHAGNVTHLQWTEDDMMLISSGEDGKVKLWNHDAELAGQMQAHVLGVRDFLLDTHGNLVTGGSDFKIRVWKRNF